MPSDKLHETQKLLYDFVWPKGRHNVKNLTLIEDIQSGGVKCQTFTAWLKPLN